MSARKPIKPLGVALVQTPKIRDVDTSRAVKTLTDAVNRLQFNNLLTVSVDDTLIGARPEVNFTAGTNITLAGVDNLVDGRIDITITAAGSSGGVVTDGTYGDVVVSGTGTVWTVSGLASKVSTSRNLNVTSPITGGGDLSADRTFGFDQTVALNNNARVTVRKNTGADVGPRRRLNLIEGSNITLTVTDDGAAEEVDIIIAAASGITPKRVVGVTFDGGGATPTVGSVGYLVCPYNGTIDQWHIVGDASGSAVVDVWKAAGSIPVDANTIAGTEKPTLSAAQLASDTNLSTWTTAVAAGDVFGFELESVATCTRVTVEVRISESA
jgi:hypothetical protein